jgi:hypothetical protein
MVVTEVQCQNAKRIRLNQVIIASSGVTPSTSAMLTVIAIHTRDPGSISITSTEIRRCRSADGARFPRVIIIQRLILIHYHSLHMVLDSLCQAARYHTAGLELGQRWPNNRSRSTSRSQTVISSIADAFYKIACFNHN